MYCLLVFHPLPAEQPKHTSEHYTGPEHNYFLKIRKYLATFCNKLKFSKFSSNALSNIMDV